jgi:hypothetical protein
VARSQSWTWGFVFLGVAFSRFGYISGNDIGLLFFSELRFRAPGTFLEMRFYFFSGVRLRAPGTFPPTNKRTGGGPTIMNIGYY